MFDEVKEECVEWINRSRCLTDWDKEDVKQTLELVTLVMTRGMSEFPFLTITDGEYWIRKEFSNELTRYKRRNLRYLTNTEEWVFDSNGANGLGESHINVIEINELEESISRFCRGKEEEVETLTLYSLGFNYREIASKSLMCKSKAQRLVSDFRKHNSRDRGI